MEKTRYMIALGVAAMTAAVSHGVAASEGNQGSNWFIGADAGVSLQQDVDVKEFLGASLSGTKIEFDPGLRFGIVGGYRFTDQWSVSLEAGYSFNSVKSIAGTPLSGSGGDIDLHQVPILANGLYTFPLKCRVKPFLGGGVGGVFSVAEFSGAASGLPSGDSQGAAAFGYQGFAGARYEINDRMELGVIYKFLGTTDNTFDDFKTEGTKAHTIGLSFIYKF
jgi:opacity protein-like surface antigen